MENKEQDLAQGGNGEDSFKRLVRLIVPRKYHYMVWTDYKSTISIKCNTQCEIDEIKKQLPDYDFIECGPITHWFMSHKMPALAMLSFWR